VLHVLVVPDGRQHHTRLVRAVVVVRGRFLQPLFGRLHPAELLRVLAVHLRLDYVLLQLADDVLQQFAPHVLRVLRPRASLSVSLLDVRQIVYTGGVVCYLTRASASGIGRDRFGVCVILPAVFGSIQRNLDIRESRLLHGWGGGEGEIN